jgi:cellulose synthase/poly-beta-1,6-N-acetylglucosamine synthase-like glycosyltransferase
MIYFLYALMLSYAGFNALLLFRWLRLRSFEAKGVPSTRISVIVAVRNEAKHIQSLLADLQNQQYPLDSLEVIIANDGSSDNTKLLVEQWMPKATFRLRVFDVVNQERISPKKRAISQAIQLAQHELIVCTDGDCRVGSLWLPTIARLYEQRQAKFISGMVTFGQEKTPFEHLQTVEFASLVGAGGICMDMGWPNMCNGANLAYPKRVFDEVLGYEGVEHLTSGDDEFLMHKIARKYPEQVFFLKSPEATVRTQTQAKWSSFFQQRKRWASKWKHYQNKSITALAIYVFGLNLAWLISLLLAIGGMLSPLDAGLLALIRLAPEALFLATVLRFLNKTQQIKWIPLTQVVYPFYVVLFGLVAQGKGFEWKGRTFEQT